MLTIASVVGAKQNSKVFEVQLKFLRA